MNQRFQASVFVCIALLALSGCDALKEGHSSNASGIELALTDRAKLVIDPDLRDEERALLVSDLDKVTGFVLQAGPTSYFGKTFGSGDSSGVIRYLSERIHYILPQSASIDSRLSISHSESSPASHSAPMILPQSGGLYTMASNIGTALWFEAIGMAPHQLQFRIGDTQVPLTSSRVGIIQLGQGYTLKHDGKYAFSQLARISTIIHEARHSDCTGGMTRSDLEKISSGEMPENHSCGHLHVRCPEGHEFEGAFACDGSAWGAYSVAAMFTAALVKNCANCDAEEQKTAMMLFADSLSRVIPLDDMMNGKLGDPDMSSSAEVHESNNSSNTSTRLPLLFFPYFFH